MNTHLLGSIKVIIGSILLLLLSSCQDQKDALLIATASSTNLALEEIVEEFKKETGIHCELVIGSSGKLAAQIKEGAPYDLFISANDKYTTDVTLHGMSAKPPKEFAQGRLVLWSMNNEINLSTSILTQNKIHHIALPNPKIATYGEAAQETLKRLKIQDTLQDKLVYGESVSQCNGFILSQSAEIGFTSLSTVLSPAMVNKGKWILIDTIYYSPIQHTVVLLKHSEDNNENSKKFYDFIFTQKAQEILKKFGYSVGE